MAPNSSTSAERLELNNIQAIIELERGTREQRSLMERTSDRVSTLISSPTFIAVHLVWFGSWIGVNVARPSFDPFPFSFLTLIVSLEAIVLSGFVLMAQNRMTRQADKRAHLDLQINLLAEQELTAILKVVSRVAERVGINAAECDPRIEQLLAQTDVRTLSAALDQELATLTAAGHGPNDDHKHDHDTQSPAA